MSSAAPAIAALCARCGLRHAAAERCPSVLVGRTVAGRFDVVRLIGAGGTAAVYKAQNVAIGRFVALKVLHPRLRSDADAVARLVREGRVMSRVRHEGIVDVLDMLADADDGDGERGVALVLEYVRGCTLAEELRRAGPFVLERAVELVGQLLATLAAVHARGLVHRDVKPANVLLSADARGRERLKLVDFGLATELDGGRTDALPAAVTPAGRLLATPRYIAPELLRGSEGRDPRVDVYGAGLVLYELLAGQPAFGARDVEELVDVISHGRAPMVSAVRPDVPSALADVLARALTKRPGERFPSAIALLEALRPFGAATDVVSADPTDTGMIAPAGVRRVAPPPASPASGRAPHRHSVFPRPDASAWTAPRDVPHEATSAPRDECPAALAPDIAELLATTTRLRGILAATLMDALRARFGGAAVAALLRDLPRLASATLEGSIDADAWLPGSVLVLALEGADARLGRGDGALCVGFGRLAAHVLLSRAHAELLRTATPESALIEAGALWRQYFDVGELRVPAVGRGYGRLQLSVQQPRRSTCLALAGFVEALLEMAGGREVELTIAACRASGDASCTFEATWMT